MFAIKTLAAAASLALTANLAEAWNGQVVFYEDIYFQGGTFTINFSTSQRCFNIGCFNDRASSASWSNIIQSGDFSGGSYIVFYTDINCGGSYKAWRVGDFNFPNNFVVDGINDAVTSFMVWENSGSPTQGYYDVCPFAPLAESGLLGENNVPAAVTNNATAINTVITSTSVKEVAGAATPATPEQLAAAKQELIKAIGEK